MKVFIAACLLVVTVGASLLEEQGIEFQAFKLTHGKTYKNQVEETKRFNIFRENLRSIEQHNALYKQGLVSYEQGINQFTDMTKEEFRATLILSPAHKTIFNATKHVKTGLAIPASVDWRTQGQVTEVKNQGGCGSCWAFSVTGSTEAAYFRKSGQLVSFSEQQFIDCKRDDDNIGCVGGWIDTMFPYLEQVGVESEADYPYTGQDGTCTFDSSKVVTKVSDFKTIHQDENALLDAVANVGPVSVLIDANDFSSYKSGIFKAPFNVLNHAVLVVGYGSENGQDFWIVKNSWGLGFGEEGYLRVARGENECGIAEDNAYPLIN